MNDVENKYGEFPSLDVHITLFFSTYANTSRDLCKLIVRVSAY